LTGSSEAFSVTEEMLDRALEDSFPASDPIAYSIPQGSRGIEEAGASRQPAHSKRSIAEVRRVIGKRLEEA
jgi:hypothetical protein